jgi:uncharacterized protein with HEPN domain
MKKNPKLFLEHILESITLIEEYTGNLTLDDFIISIMTQDMVIRRLEIIGEAIKNLPNEIKEKNQNIPWKSIAGMRDKLVHEYFGVDLKLTWNVVVNELPGLKKNIVEILLQL